MTTQPPRPEMPTGFARWPAWAKLAMWGFSTFAICALVQFAGGLFGKDLGAFGSSLGRTILVSVAVATLLGLMTADRRPLPEYGIWIRADWATILGRGWVLGAAGFAAYHSLGAAVGALEWDLEAIHWQWGLKTLEGAVTAISLAAAQQLVFSGYLLGLLRAAVGRSLAIGLCGVLFAAATIMGKPAGFLATSEGIWLSFNLAVLAMLLGLLRLSSGSVLLPTGILAGALTIRRAFTKSRLLVPVTGEPLAEWFQQGGDTRSGPLLGGLLLFGTLLAWWHLHRRGEPAADDHAPALDASFKKFVPFSSPLALAPLDLWLPRLLEARLRVEPIYWLRLAWILAISALNTLLTLPERLLGGWLLRHRVPDPVLIVGAHRSGTTHLHNLLALDPQFSVPRNLQVVNPWGALTTGWVITPLLGLFMTMRRPMDAVRVHLFSAQEEEFAIAGMTRLSPYWGFMFPREIARHDRCIHPGDLTPGERREWERCVLLFLRKLTFWRRRPPLLKSPYNTARVAAFRGLFPGARFIHICRHPRATYLSNQHLAAEGLVAFQLQEPAPSDNYATRFLGQYRRMEDAFYRDAAQLAPGSMAEVRYEDLSADPIAEVRRLYAELGLEYTLAFEARLRRYLAGIAGYQTNKHRQLSPELTEAIEREMGPYLDRWGYREERRSRAA